MVLSEVFCCFLQDSFRMVYRVNQESKEYITSYKDAVKSVFFLCVVKSLNVTKAKDFTLIVWLVVHTR